MSATMIVLLCIITLLLIFGASVIAAAETAFTRVNRTRADALAAAEAEDHIDDDDADDRVEELLRFSRRPLTTLATLTLVQVICQVGAAALSFTIGRELGERAGGYIAAALCLVLLFVAVSTSRSRALLTPDTTAVGLVPILRALAPLSGIAGFVVALARRSSPPKPPDPDVDEQQVLAIVGQTAAIDEEEEELIKRVVAFDDTVVGEIMTPRTDVVTLRSGFAVGDALEVATLHGLSRIPVTGTDSDIDDIIGAVHVKDLIGAHLDGKTKSDIDLWLRNVPAVPETQRIANLLVDLQTGDLHLALVVDEHGGVAGVVTLEDILEEIVGEIEDEFDQPEPAIEIIDARTLHADGKVEIQRVEEALGVALPPGDYRTAAGFVFSRLGRVPEVGDQLAVPETDLEFEVMRMHGRRIADLQLRRSQPFAVPLPADIPEETAS
jgi:CBS domain containing-hemolysin-like protein